MKSYVRSLDLILVGCLIKMNIIFDKDGGIILKYKGWELHEVFKIYEKELELNVWHQRDIFENE